MTSSDASLAPFGSHTSRLFSTYMYLDEILHQQSGAQCFTCRKVLQEVRCEDVLLRYWERRHTAAALILEALDDFELEVIDLLQKFPHPCDEVLFTATGGVDISARRVIARVLNSALPKE
jgi:hypothetical protein